ncbi:hypothetical protein [Clostridium oryzae]|uniref:Uncharacterized protein n=1 Tax=Clostridium oryzae TaxID=1450648 RepID=A0A1V4IEK0_9CLOT|nr:hypothetical protein [Clostridium oryzae]OPJ58438.1 hypothetical protein CLORY_35880 [Clostridium oryzae]
MYLLFRYKQWEPSKYYNLGYGEKKIVCAFLHQELEERNKEYEALNNM